MTNLEVVFDIPQSILTGLSTGTLERVGGIVRDSSSKQVVAWLRDSANWRAALNSPSPLNSVFQAARIATTLYDGTLTRRDIGAIGGQLTQLSTQIGMVTSLSALTVGGQLLNLTLTGVSLVVTMNKLNQLSNDIAQLGAIIKTEFKRERDMRFKSALQAARDVFESGESNYRDNAARSALDGLFEARETLLDDYDQVMGTDLLSDNPERLLMAKHYFLRALYAETCRIRCYLFTNGVDTARRRLTEDRIRFKDAAAKLVALWLGEGQNSAMYFHPSVERQDLDRFIYLQRWLYDPDNANDIDMATTLFHVVDEKREHFWNPTIIEDQYDNPIQQIRRTPSKTFASRVEAIPTRLGHAECVAENYDRLLGFDLELRSMRLSSFEDWNHIINESDLQQHDFGIIVDSEQLELINQRLSL